jgi:DNA-binding NarL/FixJ family response regulator
MKPIHVLLVDDNPIFLDSVACFLSTDPLVQVVGRALSGIDALAQAAQLHPDLVLMDLSMPGMSGLEATRRIKTQSDAPPKVVVLTMYDFPPYRTACAAAGADGFVSKAELGTRLIQQIHALFGSVAARAEKEGAKE